VAELELAVACPVKYAMHFTELDEAYTALGASPQTRLAMLERNHETVLKRDDALSREIGLKVFADKHDEAIHLMTGRQFSVWEGGALDVADHWINAHVARGRQEFAARQFAAALADFQAAKNIPDNLASDRGADGRDCEPAYWLGATYEAMGNMTKARQSWQEAQNGSGTSTRPGHPERLSGRQVEAYYKALAKRKLGHADEANRALQGILEAANRALHRDTTGEDPEESMPKARTALAHYIAGLSHLGLGETGKAKAEFQLALEAAPDCLGAKLELAQMR
jgi:tetratricopeptide (TPR) repeat protein